MITAKEARAKIDNLTKKRDKERIEEEKKIAEEKINEALENDKSCCRIGFKISDDTKQWLESLEYKVQYLYNENSGYNTLIIW